jgi:hypothetical protein
MEVLEVAAKTFSRERSPGNKSIHAVGVFIPLNRKSALFKIQVNDIWRWNLQSGYFFVKCCNGGATFQQQENLQKKVQYHTPAGNP